MRRGGHCEVQGRNQCGDGCREKVSAKNNVEKSENIFMKKMVTQIKELASKSRV